MLPLACRMSGSVAYGAPSAGVETAIVLDPSGLRAFAVSTPARPFGSLAAGVVGTVEVGGHLTWVV
jgi:hypothetical protein